MTVYVEKIASEDVRLARHVRHDEASRNYAYLPTADPIVSVRHHRYIDILNQLNLGSCTGNSGIGCLGTGLFYDTLTGVVQDWSENAAVQLYSDATQVDGDPENYPPNDTGSDGLSIAKVLKDRGWISGYQHAFSFDALLSALSKQPVITGVNWYRNFFRPDINGVVSIADGDVVAGGHEFVLDELDMERQLIGASNSWGTAWGVGGRFYIPFETMKRLLNERGDVTIFVPRNVPAPTPGPAPTPAPEPVPVSSDQQLWDASKVWANRRHCGTTKTVANALKNWAAASGLE